MKNRLVRAWAVLLGYDRETAADRAFRHERERIISPLFWAALGGLVTALAIQLSISPTLDKVMETLFYGTIAELVLIWAVNSAIKWHQKKYGGD